MNSKKIIKASFRGCSIEDRKQFKNNSCLVLISIGGLSHEGEKFAATIDLINRSFKSCTILIGDTLQRHNFVNDCVDLNQDEFCTEAYKLGDDWINRNRVSYEKLNIPYEVIRWDYWRKSPQFKESLSMIESLYTNDMIFKSKFDLAANEYLQRAGFGNKNTNISNCLSYLKEECAVMALWSDGDYGFELYPSGRNIAMMITYEYLIQPKFPDLLKPVALRFKKYLKL